LPAVEILRTSGVVRECIVQPERTISLRDVLAKGNLGMQTFDQALLDFYARGLINLEEALIYANIPDDFMLQVNGMQVTNPGRPLGAAAPTATIA
jgi:Tfp pilus assembly ATPase PilU